MARTEKGINCTNCGAGLPSLGGGRVKTLVCSYCGSVLDADKEFEVITQYLNMPHPDTPFQIGQTGRIKRVNFQIIGTIGMSNAMRGRSGAGPSIRCFHRPAAMAGCLTKTVM